jgi:hypothetical protein
VGSEARAVGLADVNGDGRVDVLALDDRGNDLDEKYIKYI